MRASRAREPPVRLRIRDDSGLYVLVSDPVPYVFALIAAGVVTLLVMGFILWKD